MKRTSDTAEFQFPKDGVMLTYTAGERVGDSLKIKVIFNIGGDRNLTLNGQPMQKANHGLYRAYIVLENLKTTLEVVDTDSNQKWTSDVYFLKKGYKKYRISLDDNIWFLQNLTENKDVYTSLFDDPYLALIKKIHDKHGTKFHLNLYYETPRHGGFNLSQMTDKYKEEWKANSDWMRLSFHANADKPDRPYINATYEQAYFEMNRVHKEILRFAGEEAFSKTVTTIHFGDCTVEAAKAFRDLGVKAFVSDYFYGTTNDVDIRMYCDAEQCLILQKFGYYYDKEMDIYHFRYNGELASAEQVQNTEPEKYYELFDKMLDNCPLYEFKDFCLHEQYFYPEFKRHQTNYYEKMDTIANWCNDHGYEPIFMDELFEFNTH